jgi:hypothetical protein
MEIHGKAKFRTRIEGHDQETLFWPQSCGTKECNNNSVKPFLFASIGLVVARPLLLLGNLDFDLRCLLTDLVLYMKTKVVGSTPHALSINVLKHDNI